MTYENISYDEGVRLIVELRKRSQYETGQVIRAIHGPDNQPQNWWEKLAEDTGYTVSTLQHYYRTRQPTSGSEAESKHLPRARHAISQLTPDEAAELQDEFQAKVNLRERSPLNIRPAWTPHDEETEKRIRQAELTARERELAEQDDMDRILGSTEILRDLFDAVDAVEKFVTRWSKRRVKLADAEKNVYHSGVASLRLAVDQVDRIGEGRESLEEELQRITQEQP